MFNSKLAALLAAVVLMVLSSSASATHYIKSLASTKSMKIVCISIDVYSEGWEEMSNFEKRSWKDALMIVSKLYRDVYKSTSNVTFYAISPTRYKDYTPPVCTSRVDVEFYDFPWWKPHSTAAAYANQPIGNQLQNININTYYIDRVYDNETRAGLIAHEFGHVLGLCHTNEGLCLAIKGTENDRDGDNSLFRAESNRNQINRMKLPEMTTMDERVLRAMYK